MTTVTKIEANDPRVWYKIDGTDLGTDWEFDNEEFGVCDDGTIVDSEGYPLNPGRQLTAVENALGI